jgi:glycerol transport system ATP-binding protein
MTLELKNISLDEGGEPYLTDITATFQPGINVLVGATTAGKTSLMRVMAGLYTPKEGTLSVNGVDVTGVGVRERSVSFVYQQFINYPAMSVFDNIASPLKVVKPKLDKDVIAARVEELAELLGLTPLLKRKPSELSGGQQQRVAIARALAKKTDLVLLDEPLANLDYKLREQLRDELQNIFSSADNIVIYSTAEPGEALDFAAHTFVLHEGRIIQDGDALSLYREPKNLDVALALADPPINVIRVAVDHEMTQIAGQPIDLHGKNIGDRTTMNLGIHPHNIHLSSMGSGEVAIDATVQLAEVTGSSTFVHVELPTGEYAVLDREGAFPMDPDEKLTLHFNPRDAYGFDADTGDTLFVPKKGAI